MKIAKRHIDTFFAVSFAWQLGLYIVVPIIGLLFVGKWLDSFFHSSPVFLILGVIGGFVISMYEVFRSVEVFLKNK